jgi:hypothetical protein
MLYYTTVTVGSGAQDDDQKERRSGPPADQSSPVPVSLSESSKSFTVPQLRHL